MGTQASLLYRASVAAQLSQFGLSDEEARKIVGCFTRTIEDSESADANPRATAKQIELTIIRRGLRFWDLSSRSLRSV